MTEEKDGLDELLARASSSGGEVIGGGEGAEGVGMVPLTATDDSEWEARCVEHHRKIREQYAHLASRGEPGRDAQFFAGERKPSPKRRAPVTLVRS